MQLPTCCERRGSSISTLSWWNELCPVGCGPINASSSWPSILFVKSRWTNGSWWTMPIPSPTWLRYYCVSAVSCDCDVKGDTDKKEIESHVHLREDGTADHVRLTSSSLAQVIKENVTYKCAVHTFVSVTVALILFSLSPLLLLPSHPFSKDKSHGVPSAPILLMASFVPIAAKSWFHLWRSPRVPYIALAVRLHHFTWRHFKERRDVRSTLKRKGQVNSHFQLQRDNLCCVKVARASDLEINLRGLACKTPITGNELIGFCGRVTYCHSAITWLHKP